MKHQDIYLPENDKILEKIEEEYDWYCWEEKDFQEGKLMYEYGLEGLQELAVREKIR